MARTDLRELHKLRGFKALNGMMRDPYVLRNILPTVTSEPSPFFIRFPPNLTYALSAEELLKLSANDLHTVKYTINDGHYLLFEDVLNILRRKMNQTIRDEFIRLEGSLEVDDEEDEDYDLTMLGYDKGNQCFVGLHADSAGQDVYVLAGKLTLDVDEADRLTSNSPGGLVKIDPYDAYDLFTSTYTFETQNIRDIAVRVTEEVTLGVFCRKLKALYPDAVWFIDSSTNVE